MIKFCLLHHLRETFGWFRNVLILDASFHNPFNVAREHTRLRLREEQLE